MGGHAGVRRVLPPGRARSPRAGGERRGGARGGRGADWLRVPAAGEGAAGPPWPRGSAGDGPGPGPGARPKPRPRPRPDPV